jgi:hypothetical protein
MKYILLSLALLTTAHHLSAMNQSEAPAVPQSQIASDEALTTEEMDCFQWFHKITKEDRSYFDQLSQEDRDVFKQQLKLKDHPEQVRKSRTNATRAFMAQIAQKGIEPKFSEEQIVSVLVKVTKNVSPKANTDSKQ